MVRNSKSRGLGPSGPYLPAEAKWVYEVLDEMNSFSWNQHTLSGLRAKPIAYHYAKSSIAKLILESGSLFATDYRYLNDRREIIDTQTRLLRAAGKDSECGRFIRSVVRDRRLNLATMHYVLCFSLSEDSEYMWSAYGSAETDPSCAIGYELETLARFANDDNLPVIQSPVIYEPDVQERLMDSFLTELQSRLRKSRYRRGQHRASLKAAVANYLAILGCLFKREVYRAENEYRVAYRTTTKMSSLGHRLLYRETHYGHAGYLLFPLRIRGQQVRVDRLMYGPGFTEESEREILKVVGDNDVVISSIHRSSLLPNPE